MPLNREIHALTLWWSTPNFSQNEDQAFSWPTEGLKQLRPLKNVTSLLFTPNQAIKGMGALAFSSWKLLWSQVWASSSYPAYELVGSCHVLEVWFGLTIQDSSWRLYKIKPKEIPLVPPEFHLSRNSQIFFQFYFMQSFRDPFSLVICLSILVWLIWSTEAF